MRDTAHFPNGNVERFNKDTALLQKAARPGTETEATSEYGRGFTLQCRKLWLDIGRKDVGPITGIARVGLDEEGLERCPACTYTLVVSDEVATGVGCRQHVEGACEMRLVAKTHATVG